MEYLLSLVVVRTVQLSEWTSTKARNLRCVPAIEVLRLSQVCLCHQVSALPALFSQKRGIPTSALGQEYPCCCQGKMSGFSVQRFCQADSF